MTTRPAEGTRVTYTGWLGRRYEAAAGPVACDSPCGYWVHLRLDDGRTCVYKPLSDLRVATEVAASCA